ncbi:hypothetical protein FVE85_0127 [Porphyridium purpureum]|uniref:GIY-YIG domain-containing protein n=1 Tax=Porphyridium purpureum TaxID=35688 RepID=A0A5J4YZ65_PORPP|nr:hypothetical protein FVE85_0127 [Porphyridium purpureum]|eukprot:POR7037..scf208_2
MSLDDADNRQPGGSPAPDDVDIASLPLRPFREVYEDAENLGKFDRTGAYAIFDARRSMQYLGYSKNVRRKLLMHASVQRGACQYFKMYTPPSADASGPDELERVLKSWVLQNGRLPPGNGPDRLLWEVPLARSSLDEQERQERVRERAIVPTRRTRERTERARSSYRGDEDDDLDLDEALDQMGRMAKKVAARTFRVLQSGTKRAAQMYDELRAEYVEETEQDRRGQSVVIDPLDPFAPAASEARRKQQPSSAQSRRTRSAERQQRADASASSDRRARVPGYGDGDDDDYSLMNDWTRITQQEWFPVAALFGFVTLMALLSLGDPGVSQVGQKTLGM